MTARQQLDRFYGRYAPGVAQLGSRAVAWMRRLLPGATALVYDNYNALVVGFSPSARPSEAFVSIALYPRWVTLFFLNGVTLPDPGKRLKGSGSRVRSIRIESLQTLEEPEVLALVQGACDQASPLSARKGPLVIQSISKVQRPRKPRK